MFIDGDNLALGDGITKVYNFVGGKHCSDGSSGFSKMDLGKIGF